jgi:DNA-binding PadR family transcriptional regulator
MERPSERLKRKVMIENLWIFVLKLLRKEHYGFEIRDMIKQNFGFWTGNVTAYKVLYALKRDGYVTSFTRSNKKYYSITEKGKKELAEAERFLKSL